MSNPYEAYEPRSTPLCPASGERYALHQAFKIGHYPLVKEWLAKHVVDANAYINLNRENPLKTLLGMDDAPDVFPYQAMIAKMLMAYGCELRTHDKLFMVPADYALMSRNEVAALEVIMQTIEQFGKAGRQPYVPDFTGYFLLEADNEQRAMRFNTIRRNHRIVGDQIIAQVLDAPRSEFVSQLSAEQYAYWKGDFPYRLSHFPRPPRQIKNAMASHAAGISAVWEGVVQIVNPGTQKPLNLGERLQAIHEQTYREIVDCILDNRRRESAILTPRTP